MIVATKDLVVSGFRWCLNAFVNKFVGNSPVLAEFTAVVKLRLYI